MNWSKLNPHKIPIIAASLIIFVVGTLSFYFGITKETPTVLNFTQTAPETDLHIKGNRASKIYHLKGCPNYDDIAERNIVWFKTREEAESRGFQMAKNC